MWCLFPKNKKKIKQDEIYVVSMCSLKEEKNIGKNQDVKKNIKKKMKM